MMNKEELRRRLKRYRSELTDDEVVLCSQKIAVKVLQAADWSKVRKLHIYRSVPAWKEVDTGPLIAAIAQRWPEIRMTFPTLNKNDSLPDEIFDVVIVPVLGFDKSNNRLGLGGGYYDRFLATQPQALKIGLAYQDSLLQTVPREAHDIPLDMVITEV